RARKNLSLQNIPSKGVIGKILIRNDFPTLSPKRRRKEWGTGAAQSWIERSSHSLQLQARTAAEKTGSSGSGRVRPLESAARRPNAPGTGSRKGPTTHLNLQPAVAGASASVVRPQRATSTVRTRPSASQEQEC